MCTASLLHTASVAHSPVTAALWFVDNCFLQDSESKVFYYKMKGDYYRYISEFSGDEGKKQAADQAQESYQKATETAEAELPSTHPIRLGLALNYSVFFYEILNLPQQACEMAKRAFDDAITEFDNVRHASRRRHTEPCCRASVSRVK